jgi:hypothetical protein
VAELSPRSRPSPTIDDEVTAASVGHPRRPAHLILGILVIAAFATIELLVLRSYRGSDETSALVGTSSTTTTELSEVLRDSLQLQNELILLWDRRGVDSIMLLHADLERDVQSLVGSDDPEVRALVPYLRELADRLGTGFVNLEDATPAEVAWGRDALIPVVQELQIVTTQLLEGERRQLTHAIEADLGNARRSQLILVGLGVS